MTSAAVADARAHFISLKDYMAEGLIGHEALVDRLLIGLLTGGHLLVEGPPGLAKTRAVKRLADGLDSSFARVQCTPDLMPADLTGTPVFRPDRGEFEFVKGPVFHSLVLVDEINRAPPKVQSALLEAMAENQVTAGGVTYKLPEPFLVVATQNPIEHEGTFPLPEAQLDRFLIHAVVGLPDAEREREILDLVEEESHDAIPKTPRRVSADEVLAARHEAMNTHLSPALRDYIVRLVTATRSTEIAPDIARAIEYPISPRGSLALAATAKARAWLDGRDYATPTDVAAMAEDALAHRMVLAWRATAEGETPRNLVRKMLDQVEPL